MAIVFLLRLELVQLDFAQLGPQLSGPQTGALLAGLVSSEVR